MKAFLLLPFLFISTEVFSQDSTVFQQRWTNLKSQFLVKAEAAKNFAIITMDSKKVEKTSAEKARGFSFALGQVLRMSNEPDKAVITRVSQINDSLNLYLNKIVQELKTDKAFISLNSYSEFKKNLQFALTKLYVLKYDYNKVCRESGKNDLLFPGGEDEVSFD
jgi:hypothetical protein